MKTYFVVLELPGSVVLKYSDDGLGPGIFRESALKSISERKTEIVSVRRDTGVSEEVRKHLETCGSFKTFILFQLKLTELDTQDKNHVLDKCEELLRVANYQSMVDSDERFQLIMTDYLDVNGLHVNYTSGQTSPV